MKLGVLLGILLSFASSVHADLEIMATRTLADVRIDATMQRISMRVRNCGNDLSDVKLRVNDAPLSVAGAGVIYTDGTSDDHAFRYTFNAGYDSPWMSLDNIRTGEKCAKTVYVNARSTDPRVESHVIIFGR